MFRLWLCRCAWGCAAVAAIVPLATRGDDVAPPADQKPADAPKPANRLPKLHWPEVCSFAIVDSRLALRCSLSLEVLRSLDSDPRAIDGLPGVTELDINHRRYAIENNRHVDGGELTISVFARRNEVRLDWQRTMQDGKKTAIRFVQGNPDSARRSYRSTEVTLTAEGLGVSGESITVEASDFATLRKNYPHEVNRYMRPVLRDLGSDLLQVDPPVARQVLLTVEEESEAEPTTQPAVAKVEQPATLPASPQTQPVTRPATRPVRIVEVDPKMDAQVKSLLSEVDSPNFVKREAAAERLIRLGPQAIPVFDRLDREHLSTQQNMTIDLLQSMVSPLSAEEARRLRSDLHFLSDCLYSPNTEIRVAAADRIVRMRKASSQRLEDVLRIDLQKQADQAGTAIEKLREEIIPPVVR